LPGSGLPANHERVRFDSSAGVVSGPTLPEGPAVMACRPQGFVSGDRGWAVFLPRSRVLADRDDRDDRDGVTRDDGGVATTRVVSAISSDGAKFLALGDLVEQVWQDWAVAVAAGGEFNGADVRRGRVHGQMDLAPLASALDAVLSGLPRTIAKEFDPSAVHQQVEGAIGSAIRDLDSQGLLPAAKGGKVRHRPVQSRKPEQAGHHVRVLSQG